MVQEDRSMAFTSAKHLLYSLIKRGDDHLFISMKHIEISKRHIAQPRPVPHSVSLNFRTATLEITFSFVRDHSQE